MAKRSFYHKIYHALLAWLNPPKQEIKKSKWHQAYGFMVGSALGGFLLFCGALWFFTMARTPLQWAVQSGFSFVVMLFTYRSSCEFENWGQKWLAKFFLLLALMCVPLLLLSLQCLSGAYPTHRQNFRSVKMMQKGSLVITEGLTLLACYFATRRYFSRLFLTFSLFVGYYLFVDLLSLGLKDFSLGVTGMSWTLLVYSLALLSVGSFAAHEKWKGPFEVPSILGSLGIWLGVSTYPDTAFFFPLLFLGLALIATCGLYLEQLPLMAIALLMLLHALSVIGGMVAKQGALAPFALAFLGLVVLLVSRYLLWHLETLEKWTQKLLGRFLKRKTRRARKCTPK